MTEKGKKSWNSGTSKGWTDKRGYRWVYVTEDGRRRAKREHRVIMAQYIGRKLEPWEVVHHINGNTQDNRIENLEIQKWDEHTVAHHSNAHRGASAKQSMELFANLREEIKHLRRVNTELLEACKAVAFAMTAYDEVADDQELQDAMIKVRAAIAKAEGN